MEEQEETLLEEQCPDLSSVTVFDRLDNLEPIPENFTAATLRLEAHAASTLSWKQEQAACSELVQSGRKVLFELDLGLFGPQSKALAHQGQYSSITFAINEFCHQLWQPFQEHTLGVILYRAVNPFMSASERDEKMDYLDLLRSELPDALACLLLFDVQGIEAFDFLRLFALDRFSLFTLALAHAPIPMRHCIWQEGCGLLGYIGRQEVLELHSAPTLGLLSPRYDNIQEDLRPIVDKLLAQKSCFRVIPEEYLATEWEGLDELIVPMNSIQSSTLRLIDGFKAAGGRSFEVHI
jgi:hypothetical protein